MIRRQAATALLLAAFPFGCSVDSPAPRTLQLTAPAGVTVPRIDELAAKLSETLRHASGKLYAREGGRLMEATPPPLPQGLLAVVRSYDERERAAFVELSYPRYRMPVVQIWRFDGHTWTDSIDPGIFVR